MLELYVCLNIYFACTLKLNLLKQNLIKQRTKTDPKTIIAIYLNSFYFYLNHFIILLFLTIFHFSLSPFFIHLLHRQTRVETHQ